MSEDFTFLYICCHIDDSDHASGPIKIGLSKYPDVRIKGFQTANHKRLALFSVVPIPAGAAHDFEDSCHEVFKEHRLHGEWFDLDPWHAMFSVCHFLETLLQDAFGEEDPELLADTIARIRTIALRCLPSKDQQRFLEVTNGRLH